jgi:hypothetical protein
MKRHLRYPLTHFPTRKFFHRIPDSQEAGEYERISLFVLWRWFVVVRYCSFNDRKRFFSIVTWVRSSLLFECPRITRLGDYFGCLKWDS